MDVKQKFGTSTALVITLDSLASAASRESTAVDNSVNLFLDALVRVNFTLATGTPASSKCVNIYAYGSEDGTTYGDNATGSDAALTMRVPTNLVLLKSIATPDAGGLLYRSGPLSIAAAFGGQFLPRKWGICCENLTGLAFHTTGNSAGYTGVYIGS